MHHVPSSDHAHHDPTLIAGHAAGDLADSQATAASALLASCGDCADLHRDLVALRAATRALPREARAPRDFRLTSEQAASLRRGSWLRSLLRPFASTRSAARPMAAAFTSLGVAGLLVAAFVPGLAGGTASAPTQHRDGQTVAGAPAPTAAPAFISVDPLAGGPAAAPGASVLTGRNDYGATGAPGLEAAGGHGDTAQQNAGDDETDAVGRLNEAASPINLLVFGSLGLLLVGLALFGLRLAARRLG